MDCEDSLITRLRASAHQARAIDRSDLLREAADEIERLRSQPCPYVTGKTTLHCTLTPFTPTDAEWEAIRFFSLIDGPGNVPVANRRAATLRGLLERTK